MHFSTIAAAIGLFAVSAAALDTVIEKEHVPENCSVKTKVRPAVRELEL